MTNKNKKSDKESIKKFLYGKDYVYGRDLMTEEFLEKSVLITEDEELIKEEEERRQKELDEHKKDYEFFLNDIKTGKIVL